MKKTITINLFFWMNIFVFSQALNGIYTIGGNAPDYLTINNAITALNSNGISGAVVFNIRTGTYTEQATINEISGASSINNITFQSENLDSTSVKIQFSATGANNYVLRLNGTKFLRLKNITISSTGSTYQKGLVLQNGATDNIFANNIFLGTTVSANSYHCLYCEYGDFVQEINNNQLLNNHFLKGGYQVYSEGQTNYYLSNIKLKSNIFEGSTYISVYMTNTKNLDIIDNYFKGFIYTNALKLEYCEDSVNIEKNKFYSKYTSQHIYLDNTRGTLNSPVSIKNNVISGEGTSLYMDWCSYFNIYNNSFNTLNSYIVQASSSNHINYLNNIFKSNKDFYYYYPSIDLISITSNYNVFYSDNPFNSEVNNTLYNLSQWLAYTNFETNSVFTNPNFYNDTNLHINNTLPINQVGFPITSVVDDIDGQTRQNINPDIGADEFEFDINTYHDIELFKVQNPDTLSCSNLDSLIVIVKNNSTFPIDSLKISVKLFDLLIIDSMFVKHIEPNSLGQILVSPYSFASNSQYLMEFIIDKPNGNLDQYFNNNTNKVDFFNFRKVKIYKTDPTVCSTLTELYVKSIQNSNILWSDGSTNQSIYVNLPGTYSVTITYENTCQLTDTIIIQ